MPDGPQVSFRVVRNRRNMRGRVTRVDVLDEAGAVIGWVPVTGVEWEQPANQIGRFLIKVHDERVEITEDPV